MRNAAGNLPDRRESPAPLAERLRPQNLDEFAGQEHLIGRGKVLRRMIEGDLVSSMIFWGPPGVGKTTLAPDYRPSNQEPLHQLLRRHQRHQGNPGR